MGDLLTQGTEKTEVVNDFSASISSSTCCSHITQATEGKGRDCGNEELLMVGIRGT